MPATAGRVRMPHNNRMHSSTALKMTGIWKNTIGYDPYAAADEKTETSETSYEQAKGLMALAKLSNKSSDVRGACKKCGMVGHLTFQCRNHLTVAETHADSSDSSSSSDLSSDEGEDSEDEKDQRPSRHLSPRRRSRSPEERRRSRIPEERRRSRSLSAGRHDKRRSSKSSVSKKDKKRKSKSSSKKRHKNGKDKEHRESRRRHSAKKSHAKKQRRH
ncbi:unnamed protein product [Hyaloperonospora brassicae]|uniref:CCHC-type domain-containing protein n=1 Tax=Hyaloperonospora brassicae TaxID=162125 RepID=A0AAV0T8F0_HYABA|nr:unnamed protein product [Hyaloperonospora brassicae]